MLYRDNFHLRDSASIKWDIHGDFKVMLLCRKCDSGNGKIHYMKNGWAAGTLKSVR